jgi:hypothetical protein
VRSRRIGIRAYWVVLIGAFGAQNYLFYAYRTYRENKHSLAHVIHGSTAGILFYIFVGWKLGVFGNEALSFIAFLLLEMTTYGIELAFSIDG